jgi:hypothetical protein
MDNEELRLILASIESVQSSVECLEARLDSFESRFITHEIDLWDTLDELTPFQIRLVSFIDDSGPDY